MRWRLGWGCAAAFAVTSSLAWASETTTYVYDELGRLVAVNNSGGPRNGKSALTTYDPAGNRTAQAVGVPTLPLINAAVFSITGPGSSVAEGDVAVFTVTKTGTASSALSVNYATANGTAAAPGDFAAAAGTLTFLAWETVRTISVPIIDDGIGEGAETFSAQLSGASSGASIGTASASATIAASAPANQPPVPVTDGATVKVCESIIKNVVANDTDPEGNYPLSLVSVTVLDTAKGSAFVSGTTNVYFTAYGATGSARVDYVVKDSLGATATGRLNVTITSGSGCS